MLGVTIGFGKTWHHIADSAAARMHKMTGLDCEVLGIGKLEMAGFKLETVCHPSWLKAHILKLYPAENEFLIFDADIFCLRPWDPRGLFESVRRQFCAVPDRNHRIVYDECCAHGLPFPDWYVNGGLLMFSREHQPIWDAVWARHPKYGRWLEQTALNKTLQEQNIEVCRLPRIFNRLPNLGPSGSEFDLEQMQKDGVVNFHLADCGGDGTKILELQRRLKMI